jgi:hypothetical protein
MAAHPGNSFSREEWSEYYSRKRIIHQWTQVDLLNTVPCRRVLEIGPAMGLVTAMLVNAGYEVETLDNRPRAFAHPDVRNIERDLRAARGADLAGFDAILCCETLEHLEWPAVGPVLSALHDSGASYLVVSVPYMEFQLAFDLYANRYAFRHYFSLKKWLANKVFAPEPPGGHQWEVGYKGYRLPVWERRLRDAGWSIRRRVFTEHCRSVFHLLQAA